MQKNIKLSVLIPVYNERNTIQEIFHKVVSAEPKDKEIIVIDDGSIDGTRDILGELKKKFSFELILNPKNLGKGASLIKALSSVKGDIVVPQDADLELNPKDYIKLMEPILKNKADIVFGTRLKYISIPNYIFSTLFVNKLFVYLINILYGGHFTDIMTGYKMGKIEVLRDLKLRSQRFDIEPEIACKVLKKRYKVIEIPVSYHSRGWNEGKKIKWTDTFGILKAIIKYRFMD